MQVALYLGCQDVADVVKSYIRDAQLAPVCHDGINGPQQAAMCQVLSTLLLSTLLHRFCLYRNMCLCACCDVAGLLCRRSAVALGVPPGCGNVESLIVADAERTLLLCDAAM